MDLGNTTGNVHTKLNCSLVIALNVLRLPLQMFNTIIAIHAILLQCISRLRYKDEGVNKVFDGLYY